MKKRGLSAVITTLIIVLLVLVAVGVVWVVIANLINQGAEEISLGKFTLNMEIKGVNVKGDGTVDVKVKRNAGKGDLSGIKFLVNDGVEVHEFTEETTMGELGQRTFILNYDGLVKEVSIAPIFELDSGKESIGNEIDSEEIPKKKIIENLGGINWWRFEGNVLDEIGNNDGILNGDVNCNVQGKFGRGCSFDGGADYIEAGRISLSNQDITVGAWVKPSGVISDTIIGTITGGAGDGFALMTQYGGVGPSFWVQDYPETQIVHATTSLDNEWHYVVGVREGTNLYIYVDGELEEGESYSVVVSFPDNDEIVIGRMRDGQHEMTGLIDEVIIFNKALSESEVRALHELDLS